MEELRFSQNPTHSYAAGNNSYTIKLVITDTVGCQDSVTKPSYVSIRPPTAAFDIVDTSGICLPLLTNFVFKGSDYASFYWDFGDGTSTTAQSPSHFYNDYGTFTPKLFLTGWVDVSIRRRQRSMYMIRGKHPNSF